MADNDFGKKIEDFGKNIWEKAQSAVDVVSINNDIVNKNRELDKVYSELGAAYLKQYGDDAKKNFPQLYEEASLLTEALDLLQSKLQQRKGVKKCPACGELVPLDALFCSHCGARLPEPEPEPEPAPAPAPDENACKACGTPLVEGNDFCCHCGAKRE